MSPNSSHPKIHPASPDAIQLASRHLRDGKLIGLPTETVYGLAARGDQSACVNRIFAAKNRPANNPLILHVDGLDAVLPLVQLDNSITQTRLERASQLWPGPLTLVLPRSPRVINEVTAGGDTVAVRVPEHPVALELLKVVGLPIAAPSANVSNYISPTRPEHVIQGLESAVEMVLDGGPCRVGLESTVLSIANPQSPPRILREGMLSVERLQDALQEPVQSSKDVATPPNTTRAESCSTPAPLASPGMLRKHYSPTTPLRLVKETTNRSSTDGRVLRLRLRTSPHQVEGYAAVWDLSETGDPNTIAARLYDVMREADAACFDAIEMDELMLDRWPQETNRNLLIAIQDRLVRAAQQD
ncbi:threonylcarbamoyl-AMP synthase [Rhodopirellula sp. JC740]|uniref:Threonylcarbamoyl-AMP synthase n=1 Tax=Rhodopirellula halodulae TaxID=2894198 RepID=A0ABS8NCT0_9BACT|nr:L-threonylcarbamoyladenylate synthase [Rhodopirellula sp. JC740]MCC9641357.1 threonylcarbamoyl-AMP synthase [Rhodopirellula sp. JC740]